MNTTAFETEHMLSASQAQIISDHILSLNHRARLDALNSKAPPVPLLFRCPELTALPPWQRQQVIEFALRSVNSSRTVLAVLSALLLAFAAVMFFVPGSAATVSLAALVIFFIVAGPTGWVRAVLARREIIVAARELSESSRIEG